jgi:hypothetical protein
VLIPEMHTVYFGQAQTFYYISVNPPLSSTFFHTVFSVCVIILSSYMCVMYFEPLHPLVPCPSWSSSHRSPRQPLFYTMSHYYYCVVTIIIIILGLEST